jgi:hypothetical protein
MIRHIYSEIMYSFDHIKIKHTVIKIDQAAPSIQMLNTFLVLGKHFKAS